MLKRAPMILGLVFISVTVHRVAIFSGGGFNGWVVATGLAAGVFLSSYFTELKTTRRAAFVSLVFFVIVDGLFNVSEVLRWSVETGRWNFAIEFGAGSTVNIYRWTDPVYGLFPTLAAALLGWLSKMAEKAIRPGKGTIREQLVAGLLQWAFGHDLPEVSGKPSAEAESGTKDVPETTGSISGNLPPWLPRLPADRQDFRRMVEDEDLILPPGLTGDDMVNHIPAVGTGRTGRSWLKDVGYRRLEEERISQNGSA